MTFGDWMKWNPGLSGHLDNFYHRSMMRSAYTDRIILSPINLVQHLKQNPVSYILLGITLTASISYIGIQQFGQWSSYVTNIPSQNPVFWFTVTSPLPVLGMTKQTGFDDFEPDDDDDGENGEDDGDNDEDEKNDAEKVGENEDSPDTTEQDPDQKGDIFSQGQTVGKDVEDNIHQDEGVIYARVSSDEQTEHSIDTQISTLRKKATELEIELPHDPICDEGKTGGNFDRDGIKKVFRLAAEDEITHLLVDDVSRIGRNAPQTLYFIYTLKKQFGVTIITAQGDLDVDEIDDLLDATLTSLVSHISAKQRGRKALSTKIRRFTEERSWFSWFRNAPLGYRKSDDGWIEPYHKEVALAEQMFQSLLDGKSYGDIAEQINAMAQQLGLSLTVSAEKVKRSLKNPVYVGKPTISSDTRELDDDEAVVEDDDLQIIEDEIFAKAQREIEDRSTQRSTSKGSMDVDDFIEAFGSLNVLENVADVQLICPDCGTEMVKNGNVDLIDGSVHNYICKECGRQRQFPKKTELQDMVDQVLSLLETFDIEVCDE